MTKKALGIIETYGYLGAVEAADVASKTANIEILGIEKVKGGLMTVEITGDVAAVKVAVDASVASCEKLGIPVTGHIIPRPIDDLWGILAKGKVKNKEEVKTENIKVEKIETEDNTSEEVDKLTDKMTELKSMRVVDLRSLARELEGIEIPRGEIKYANKAKLLEAFEKFYRSLGDE